MRYGLRLAPPLALIGALFAQPGPAEAQGWTINGQFSQGFRASSNVGLDEDGGFSYGSVTRLGLSGNYATDETRISLSTGVSLRAFGGNDDDVDDINVAEPDLRGTITSRFGRLTLFGNTNFRIDNVAFTQFDEDGGVDETGIFEDSSAIRTDFGISTGLSLQLTPRTSVSATTFANARRFSGGTDAQGDNLANSQRFGVGLSLGRSLTQRTSLSLSTNISASRSDDAENTDSESVSVSVGLNHQLAQDLSLSASAGARVTRVTEDVAVPLPVRRETDTTLGGIGSFALLYQTGDTTARLGLNQSLDNSDDGSIDNVTRVTAGLSQRLNSRADVSLRGAFTVRQPISSGAFTDTTDEETTLFLQVSPSFGYNITEDWRASLSYSLRVGDDEGGPEVSNGVFLNFSRPLRLFRR